MMIVVLLMSSCLFLFVSYQLYLRLLVEKLDSEDRTLKRKINFYKYQKNSRLMIYLLFSVCLLSVLLLGIVYTYYQLNQRNIRMEQRIERLAQGQATQGDKIKKQAIKKTALNQFTWKQAVSAESAAVLTNYELQLAREWRPYLGETSITMIRSEKTQTLTLSVFSVGLSYHAALNSVKEITMIDFNFTYRDQEQTLVKSIDTYARETLETNLEPVVIS
mgnify:CR=1 FL=1